MRPANDNDPVVNTVPDWVVDAGLIHVWFWMQDMGFIDK